MYKNFTEFYNKNKENIRRKCKQVIKSSDKDLLYSFEDLEQATLEYLLKYPSLWQREGKDVSDSSTIHNAVKSVYYRDSKDIKACGTIPMYSKKKLNVEAYRQDPPEYLDISTEDLLIIEEEASKIFK